MSQRQVIPPPRVENFNAAQQKKFDEKWSKLSRFDKKSILQFIPTVSSYDNANFDPRSPRQRRYHGF